MVRKGKDLSIVHLLNPADRARLLGRKTKSEETLNGGRVFRYPYTFQMTPLLLLASLKDSHFRDKEVVHVFTGANTIMGVAYLLLARLTRKQAGVSVFGKDFLASRPSRLFFVPLILSLTLASRVMVNSTSTLSQLPHRFRRKATILYPGVDPATLGAETMPEKDPAYRRVLFVGRLVRRKGLVELLEAFEIVSRTFPDARLILVGDGPFRPELEQLVSRSPVRHLVEMKGMLTGAPLFREYATCDVFVMPSKTTATDTEGFGMVFLEAAFFARPAVGTRSGGIPEAVVDGETGLLVDQDDVEDLGSKIVTLLSDRNLAERLGANARERVLSSFTWEKATEKFMDMYQTGPDRVSITQA